MAKKSTSAWSETDLTMTWEEQYPNMGVWLQAVRSELNRAKLPGTSQFPRYGISMDTVRQWWDDKTQPKRVPAIVRGLL